MLAQVLGSLPSTWEAQYSVVQAPGFSPAQLQPSTTLRTVNQQMEDFSFSIFFLVKNYWQDSPYVSLDGKRPEHGLLLGSARVIQGWCS